MTRPDETLPKAPAKTTCPYCGVGCGVEARLRGNRNLSVAGDAAHPANQGRLCSKGTALGPTFGLKGRLLEPKIRKNGKFQAATWDEALDSIARKFNDIITEHGPDAVAFYVSGQILTEDYYAANKLAKGYIGTANIDTNSRLCMSSAVAAHKIAFGADLVPGLYEDIEMADLLVFSGHNAAWTHPVLYRRLEARTDQKRVCIDPRRTDTSKACDLHLMIKPQTDVRLWNGLCAWLITQAAVDEAYVNAHTEGFEVLRDSLFSVDQSPETIAEDCGIELSDLMQFYEMFLETPKTVSLFSQGSNQSAQGVSKGLSLINAHLLTGRIGKPGAAPFSITGQPNAMGGREVGGLANMLACHMDFDEVSRSLVQRYWQSPTLAQAPGLKAVDMFEAARLGKVKAIWIMATNPMVSLPDTDKVREALEACELVVVSDVVDRTDTLDMAHIQLPAAAWGEKDGTVTNSERMISRQRLLAAPPGQARPDWQIIADVARRMNSSWDAAFSWSGAHAVFDEYAGLTAFENRGGRFLNLSGLMGLGKSGYNALQPTRWPCVKGKPPAGRLFADGRFNTPNGRARLKPVTAKGPALLTDATYPFSLTTARVRDHWHTLTRTGLAPELNRHISEPMVEVHPVDAERLKLRDGRLTRITTPYGEAIVTTRVTEDVRIGSLGMPIHWTRVYAPFGKSNPLISPHRDPVSGQPEFKHMPARLAPFGEDWHGFVLRPRGEAIDEARFGGQIIWRRSSQAHAELYEIAGQGPMPEADRFLGEGHFLTLDDPRAHTVRRVHLDNGRLRGVVFLAPIHKTLPPRDWLLQRFGDVHLSLEQRKSLLIGRQPGVVDQGRIVCACRGIGEKTIEAAIARGARTVEAIGAATTAGTQCGSCRSECGQILQRMAAESGQARVDAA